MNDVETRAQLLRHWLDLEDLEMSHEIYHEDVIVEFPQSGELFNGRANLQAMREAYPAKVAITVRQSRGTGNLWITETIVTYDGQKQVNGISIMEFRDGKVARETIYFGDPFEAPAWRKPYTEQIERTPRS
jgi:hypothetical protein